jgi:hypothetical protein
MLLEIGTYLRRPRVRALLALLILAVTVVVIFSLTGETTERERFISLAKQVTDNKTNTIVSSELGDRVCLIEEGSLTQELLVKTAFPDLELNLSELSDQSVGYWTLVIVDRQRREVTMVSIDQSEVEWRWVEPSERDDKRKEEQLICLDSLTVVRKQQLQILN